MVQGEARRLPLFERLGILQVLPERLEVSVRPEDAEDRNVKLRRSGRLLLRQMASESVAD